MNTSFYLYPSPHSLKKKLFFDHISLEQGLSQSSVYCILQDRKGFLWFATEEGLNRYDGYNFVVYKRDLTNPNSLTVDWIWHIVEDHKGMLWIGTAGGGLHRFDPEKEIFTNYQTTADDPDTISDNFISSIAADREGGLWVGTHNGFNRFDRKSRTFKRYQPDPANPNGLSDPDVRVLYMDSTGLLWVGTEKGGLNTFDPQKERFTHYVHQPGNEKSLSHNYVRAIYEDRSGVLWIGTMGGGLNKFDRDTGTFIRYRSEPENPNSLSHDGVIVIYEDRSGTLWVGTNNGLNVFDREKEIFTRYLADIGDPDSLSVNAIRSIFEDRGGVLWVGTYLGGLNKLNRVKERFSHYHMELDKPTGLSDNRVWAILEDQSGVLWIGTSGGLNKADDKRQTFTHYRHEPGNPNSLSHNQVMTICEDHTGTLWVGTYGGGLNRFVPGTETFTRYLPDPADSNSLSEGRVLSIFEDRAGILWLGTFGGLNRFEVETGAFTPYRGKPGDLNSLSHDRILAIYEDRTGAMWIGTYGGGLNRFDRESETFIRCNGSPGNPAGLVDSIIYFIGEDRTGILWIGGDGGLSKFDRENQQFVSYGIKNGLPNEVIYGALEDERGNLWASTNRGLAMFNPQTKTFKNFDIRDGLQSNEFNIGAFYKSRNGEMFFGGINGFNSFFPDRIRDDMHVPSIVITDLKIFNTSVHIGEKIGRFTILKKTISRTGEIRLSHKHSVFSFEYAGLHYAVPEKNQYAYKMEGLEEEWNYVGNRRFATYAHVAPGEYVFRVKGSNNDGVWNEQGTSLKITIVPPFWKTVWFYALCALAVLLSGLAIHRLRVRSLKKQEKKLTRLVKERTQELEKANRCKSDFLARMSHEIRTPMNSIIGFTDLIMETPLNGRQTEFIHAIKQSGETLLDIINEILDLSRVEAGQLSLEPVVFDLKTMAFNVCELIIPRIGDKSIEILCRFGAAVPPMVKGDGRCFRKVLINLMGNAVKFTEAGVVELTMHVEKEENHRFKLHTMVRDTGIGIPGDKRDLIFEAFQQVDISSTRGYDGTGLGLSISKEIAQLMGGDLWVESETGKGSTFHFTAWLERETGEKDEEEAAKESMMTQSSIMEVTDKPPVRILMAEDNQLNRKLVGFMLNDTGYRLEIAANGKEAVEKFCSDPDKFDLILMDIQMPEMDGKDAARKIREKGFSRVPIIALTAASMKGDREKCVEAGMNDYISKPIKREILYETIKRWVKDKG